MTRYAGLLLTNTLAGLLLVFFMALPAAAESMDPELRSKARRAADAGLVVRLEGTKVEEGRKILNESGLAITSAATMAEGAQKIVELAKG